MLLNTSLIVLLPMYSCNVCRYMVKLKGNVSLISQTQSTQTSKLFKDYSLYVKYESLESASWIIHWQLTQMKTHLKTINRLTCTWYNSEPKLRLLAWLTLWFLLFSLIQGLIANWFNTWPILLRWASNRRKIIHMRNSHSSHVFWLPCLVGLLIQFLAVQIVSWSA